MIKGSLITAFIIFASYNVFVFFVKEDISHAQYNYQENVIKADKYLFNKTVPHAIILGSSLSGRIVPDSLPGIYNLALYGMGPFDGANILLKKDAIPAIILIETNLFYKPANENFKKSFDNNTMLFLKGKLPALRDEYQPVGISYGFIKKMSKNQHAQMRGNKLNNAFFETLVNTQKKLYQTPDTNLINLGIIKLRVYIDEIRKRGSKICFYEMPVNSELEKLPQTLKVRDAIFKNFPEITYIQPPGKNYVSSDALHLGPEEAAEYTAYLKTKLHAAGIN